MNNKAFTLSLVMAVLAVFFVSSYVTSIEDATKVKFGTDVLVVVAKRDIKEMETLNDTTWEFQTMPKMYVEPTAVFFEGKKPTDDKVTDSLRAGARSRFRWVRPRRSPSSSSRVTGWISWRRSIWEPARRT